ncbi:unnamed protein product [Mytilus edulis]|uniref:B box-type domain-containing protein n=1 Tax=Mytilus edulis TaxID=6550 RepID=A0A8S3V9I3_MYTED|nr:unnamed protein product [Mytilus edulis]
MADDTFEHVEKQEIGKSPKTVRCRFHETEEYQMFCKDCKDFLCFECLEQLHNKHNLCRLKNAEEDIRKEMEALVFDENYVEQLTTLSDKLSENKKKLVQDEERLRYEIRNSVEQMKQQINLSEENLLSELRNTFESNQTTLQDHETHVNTLQIEISYVDVNKLHEHNLSHIINILSEMKLISFKCDTITNRPTPGFKPTMKFSIGNIVQESKGKCGAGASLSSCSNISTQTDTEWFDSEDMGKEDLIECSSDEVTDEKI